MTTTDIALPAAPTPDRLSQATAIEQSRAVAQVQAAVMVARQYPRSTQAAIRAMREACSRPSLAKTAFYEYRRGTERVTGSTIKLAQELARIWGNVDFGLAELSLNVESAQSEMLAYAWDLESNSRFSQIVIVRHVRDKKIDGVKVAERVADQRDVYELNTSNAARRLRECIRRVVPDWFFEEAEDLCRHTIENPGDGLTLDQRIAQLLRGFEQRWGLDTARIEARVGKPIGSWIAWDVAQLDIAGQTLIRGEATVDEVFPAQPVTAAEIMGTPAAPAEPARAQQQPAKPESAAEQAPEGVPEQPEAQADPPATQAHLKSIHSELNKCGVADRTEKLATIGRLIGRPLASSAELTKPEALAVIRMLGTFTNGDDPATALQDHLLDVARAAAEAQQ